MFVNHSRLWIKLPQFGFGEIISILFHLIRNLHLLGMGWVELGWVGL